MLRRFRQRVFDVIIKSEPIAQILLIALFDHIQCVMEIVQSFLCQINLLRCLCRGIGNEGVSALYLILCKFIQRHNLALILAFKG